MVRKAPELLRFASVRTPLFAGCAALSERGLCYLGLNAGGRAAEAHASEGLRRWAARWAPAAELRRDAAALEPLERELLSYSAGELERFATPLDLRGSEFQRRVWAGLLRIGYGRTQSYGELARAIGSSGAARAVGSANGANPVPILVPCHRVVASDGLGGYGLGLPLKRALLELEGAL